MQGTIPDDIDITAQAKAAGFDSVDEYGASRLRAIDENPPGLARPKRPRDMTPEERRAAIDAYTEKHQWVGNRLDDSRESIYAPRIRKIVGIPVAEDERAPPI